MISGRMKKETIHPHAKSLNVRSCHKATNVKMSAVFRNWMTGDEEPWRGM
jgi:hypothetical protein